MNLTIPSDTSKQTSITLSNGVLLVVIQKQRNIALSKLRGLAFVTPKTKEKSDGSLLPPEMMAAIRAAILKPQDYYSHLKTALFHSTPILQRKHQSNSKARSKRFGRKKAKQDWRRNVNAFAQHLFGIWSDGFDYSGKHTSWFEKQYSRVSKRNRNGKRHIPQHLDKRCFDFSEVDEGYEIEYFLKTALGGSRGFSWSNTREGGTRSGRYSNNFRKSWGSRYRLDEEEEEEEYEYSSTGVSDTEPNQESHRQTLGLSSSGPLNLEDVKIAYRACALKWHPDRHHTSTKKLMKSCSSTKMMTVKSVTASLILILLITYVAAKGGGIRGGRWFGGRVPSHGGSGHRNSGLYFSFDKMMKSYSSPKMMVMLKFLTAGLILTLSITSVAGLAAKGGGGGSRGGGRGRGGGVYAFGRHSNHHLHHHHHHHHNSTATNGEFFHGVVGVSASSELGGLVLLADLIETPCSYDFTRPNPKLQRRKVVDFSGGD
ncbi:unnamed protein product [Arabidopsis thaliana]|uniref:J domain-containing protein n=1 Tax=Arabidopsis thaliana TaxID=3702 RepID=A0A5S9XLW9_ARATH|nr:unnamed protein product [Arabidopsis thaliana]